MKLHNALVEMSRGSRGLGCGGETTGAVFCKENGVGPAAAAKRSGRAAGAARSLRQPQRAAAVQEAAGERFSQGPVVWLLRLYQCSGY